MPQTQVISSPLPLNKSTEKILQKNPKELPLGGRIRYNIFINLIVIVIAGLPFFVPTYITMGMNAFYAFSWVVFVTLAGITQYKIRNYLKTFDSSKLPENVTKTKLIMATFVYKEPLDLILTALKNLSEQKIASEIIMAVCMEERTPEKENKISKILSEFSNTFSRLIITVHPYGTEGEIPGKCSNSNYALRSIVQELQAQTEDFKPEDYVVTNFDVDTRFHPRFIEMVQRVTSEEKDRNNVVWQPVLYYNWGLDKLSFFTRMTGLVRNIFMMGALIPFNINIMSVYTASLKLYIDGDYCHPGYQMDDIICYIRWLTLTKRSLKIKPIYCPTISGPTSGKNMIHEFSEWARQGRRWSIGSAEVFHYFCIKARRIGFVTAFTWAINYLNYYAGFLCAQTFLMFTTTIVISLEPANTLIPQLYFLIPLGVVYSCLLMVMVLNKYALATYLKELNVVENIPFYKDVIHWISGLFVMIGYSFVVAYGFCEIIFQGKKVCKHGASSKVNLVAKKAAKVDEVQIEIAGL